MMFVAFSGGKDSTALAYRMAEMGESFEMIFTPTGNELPEVAEHVERVRKDLDRPLHVVTNGTLGNWIEQWKSLPNHRQRWCTRVLKVQPCLAFLKARPGSVLCVGLRADEEERAGLYGDVATYRYPLREWGWGLAEVKGYLRKQGIEIPWRTNCAVCFWQRSDEWHRTWREYPDLWSMGEFWEGISGHTFTWGVSMRERRGWFERGGLPRATKRGLSLFNDEEIHECRVCSL